LGTRAAHRFQVVGAIFILVGLLSAAAAHPTLGAPTGIMGDVIFWPPDGSPGAPALPTERLYAAIAGGLMTGWGVMLILLGRGATVARAFLAGGLAWFVVDGIGSMFAGVPLNILGNVPFLAAVVWATRPAPPVPHRQPEGQAGRVVPGERGDAKAVDFSG
jgi:hypothetical protein